MSNLKITPELIPHTMFHTGIWLLSVKRPDWYYFMKKKNRNIIEDKNFMKSVDRPLRNLVKFLHKRGIKTTPSCSGHHISERNLEKIYETLEEDRSEIISHGLQLKDVETGKIYFYKNENYVLPWTKKEFIDQVSAYQQKGVIGLRLGNRKTAKNEMMKLEIEGVTIRENDNIVFILTNEDNKGDNRRTWRKITRAVKTALSKLTPAAKPKSSMRRRKYLTSGLSEENYSEGKKMRESHPETTLKFAP